MTLLFLGLFSSLQTTQTPNPQDILNLIEGLASEDIEEREKCSSALRRIGGPALELLKEAKKHSDPEVAGRAYDLCRVIWSNLSAEELANLPFEKLNLSDIDLHTLTLAVQRVTRKEFLWAEDLCLRKRRISVISDVPLQNHRALLFHAYQAILQVNELTLTPLAIDGEKTYKISPSSGSRRRIPVQKDATVPDTFTARIFSLRNECPQEVQAALREDATFSQTIQILEQGQFLLATDFNYKVSRFETILRSTDGVNGVECGSQPGR